MGSIRLAKYEDFCRKCYAKVEKNDKVYWEKGRGTIHFKCWLKK